MRLLSAHFVQMALGLSENSTDRECVVSERTFYDFRKKFQEVDGPWLVALSITSYLCDMYSVEVEVVHFDSSDVRSNVKNLSSRGRTFPGVPLLRRKGVPEGVPGGGGRVGPGDPDQVR
jgi:hypothetical protein